MYVHTSVLLQECLDFLTVNGEKYENSAFMVDSTLGEGGHSEAFLQTYPNLSVIGLDADPNIQKRARERLSCFGDRMAFFSGWFDDFYASYPSDIPRPNIVLFDLGISIFHYELSDRGFSFKRDESLDMRLNPQSQQNAADIVNTATEAELADMLFYYAEERYSRRIARAIVQERQQSRIVTAKALADLVWRAVPQAYRRGKIHPATKTFQALRIEVNKEFERLERVLENALDVLEVGGKMGVITFHSLEDKIVKNFFRDAAKECICPPEQARCICKNRDRVELITRKPISASEEELKNNSPSRSARLRVVRKIRSKNEE